MIDFYRWRRGPESNRPTRICNPRAYTARRVHIPGGELRASRLEGAKRALLAGLFPILTACGGGGSDPPACPNPHPVRLQIFGDSINHTASTFLQAALGSQAVVIDRAVPGTTSQQLIDGTDGLNLPWPQSFTAPVGIENMGMNDSYAPLGITLEQYRANIERLAVAGMVLQTPSPSTSPLYDTAPLAAVVREVAAAKHAPLADVRAYVLSVPGWQQHLSDGIHPDAALHEMIAQNVTGPVLAPLVERARCSP